MHSASDLTMDTEPGAMLDDERRCRALVSQRSRGMCERCTAPFPLEKAHRLPRSQGGPWSPANVLDLCWRCHRHHHAHPHQAYEGGWHLHSTQHPTLTPALLNRDGTPRWYNLTDTGHAHPHSTNP